MRGNIGKRVERGVRHRRAEARDPRKLVVDQLRARRELHAHRLDARCAVRQRLDDRGVEEARDRVRHLPLQLDELGRHRLGRRHVADAPAGHRVALAHAVDGDRARRERRVRAGRRMHEAGRDLGVDQLLVDLVGDHGDLLVLRKLVAERAHLVGRIRDAARVRRRVPHDADRARRDRRGELGGRDAEAMLDEAGDLDAPRARELDERLVRHPRGRRQQHLVAAARLDDRLQRHVDRVLRADGDGHLVEGRRDAVLLRELRGDRLARGLVAGRGRVLRHALLERLNGHALDVVGRVEVGLAHREGDDIAPLCARGGDLGADGKGGGLGHRRDAARDEHAGNVMFRAPRGRPVAATLAAPMHYDAHQPVIDELEARINTLRDSL